MKKKTDDICKRVVNQYKYHSKYLFLNKVFNNNIIIIIKVDVIVFILSELQMKLNDFQYVFQ